jgi:hypothetical protein
MKGYPPLFRRLWNMRPWRRSPLMRASYRVESVVHAVAVMLMMLVVPLAVALGSASYSHAVVSSRPAPGVHPVQATLAADADTRAAILDDEASVQAHWSVQGRTHTDMIEAAADAKKGDRVSVWVGPNGNQVPAPVSRSTALPDALITVFATVVLAASGIVTLLWGVRALLYQRRCRRWDTDWATLAGSRKSDHP